MRIRQGLFFLAGLSGIATAEPFPEHWVGSVGDSNCVDAHLVRKGDSLEGTYAYRRFGKPIRLRGKISPTLRLEELDATGKPVAIFEGKIDGKAPSDELNGTWRRIDAPAATEPTEFEFTPAPKREVERKPGPIARIGDVELRIEDRKLRFVRDGAAGKPIAEQAIDGMWKRDAAGGAFCAYDPRPELLLADAKRSRAILALDLPDGSNHPTILFMADFKKGAVRRIGTVYGSIIAYPTLSNDGLYLAYGIGSHGGGCSNYIFPAALDLSTGRVSELSTRPAAQAMTKKFGRPLSMRSLNWVESSHVVEFDLDWQTDCAEYRGKQPLPTALRLKVD